MLVFIVKLSGVIVSEKAICKVVLGFDFAFFEQNCVYLLVGIYNKIKRNFHYESTLQEPVFRIYLRRITCRQSNSVHYQPGAGNT